jgi:hypothetical protein
MNRRVHELVAVVSATFGVAAVAVAELFLWTGRPPADAYETDVLRYYATWAGRIRLGDLIWTAGLIALVGAVMLVRHRFNRSAGRVVITGVTTCAALLIVAAAVSWSVAGDAVSHTVSGSEVLNRWSLQQGLVDGAVFLLCVPVMAAAVGLDRDRRHGVAMTALGVVAACSLVLPLEPWNLIGSMAWLAGAIAFTVHGSGPRPARAHRTWARRRVAAT